MYNNSNVENNIVKSLIYFTIKKNMVFYLTDIN